MSSPDDIPRVGDELPALTVSPTPVQLFAFSAATWNTHRIHYDGDYAREGEGYPDVLVQSYLYACFVTQALRAAYGPEPRLARLGWQNRGIAVPGDRLTVTGQVTEVLAGEHGVEVSVDIEQRNHRGELCIRGWATLGFAEDGGG